MIEFAVMMPIVLVLVLFAVDVGRGFLAVVSLNNATRLAANYASLHPTAWTGAGNATYQAEYRDLVQVDFAGMGCVAPGPIPLPEFPSGTSLGSPVRVSYECNLSLVTPIFPLLNAVSSLFGGARFAEVDAIPVGGTSVFAVRGGVIDVAGGGGGGGGGGDACATTPRPVAAIGASPSRVDRRRHDGRLQ